MSGKEDAAAQVSPQSEESGTQGEAVSLPSSADETPDAASSGLSAPPAPAPGIFPIEGESRWVSVMRLMAASIIAGIIAIGGIFQFLAADDSYMEQQQLALIMGGIVFLMLLEYFVFLLVIIPRQANFSRYAIYQTMVEFFPLASLGLSAAKKSTKVAISRFKGVVTGGSVDKKGKPVFCVYLLHADEKGKTINIKSFPSFHEAEAFAKELAAALGLNVASLPASRRRAL